MLHFVDMGETQLHDAGIDRLRIVLLLELADEGGGHQAYAVPVIEQPAEVILLDVDGLVRAHLHAFSAIHALVTAFPFRMRMAPVGQERMQVVHPLHR